MSQILPSFCIDFLYLFKSFCCFFLLSFSLSLPSSLPPLVPYYISFLLSSCFFLLSTFLAFISFQCLHFSSFLVIFVALLVFFFLCVLRFFPHYFRSRRLPSSFVIRSLSLRVGAFTAACCSSLLTLCLPLWTGRTQSDDILVHSQNSRLPWR
jgi:hypothetical protein